MAKRVGDVVLRHHGAVIAFDQQRHATLDTDVACPIQRLVQRCLFLEQQAVLFHWRDRRAEPRQNSANVVPIHRATPVSPRRNLIRIPRNVRDLRKFGRSSGHGYRAGRVRRPHRARARQSSAFCRVTPDRAPGNQVAAASFSSERDRRRLRGAGRPSPLSPPKRPPSAIFRRVLPRTRSPGRRTPGTNRRDALLTAGKRKRGP